MQRPSIGTMVRIVKYGKSVSSVIIKRDCSGGACWKLVIAVPICPTLWLVRGLCYVKAVPRSIPRESGHSQSDQTFWLAGSRR
ncbi:hypothetical protein RRG08_000622 [Elysia crispata]|uniref:Uncharacterized protein n=1 Tax=Elysia crispata TaxID=231223 RepID=A0AAE0Y8E3_9GAST|nr:hypothetical protein RRG08_000622 [Elysia crispata]